jgi:PAS domain S-box-containing protein
LLGYSPDELLGKPFDDFWSPDLRQFFQDEFGSLMKSGGEIKHLRLRRKDGNEISVILNGRVQRDPRGNFLRTHCILTDITDQKLIEENLRRSKIFIDSVLENLPSMIFVKDAKDLRFLRFNKAGEELLGYRRDELLGRNDYDIFPKEEADFFITKDREVLRSGCLLDIPEEPIQTRGNGLRFLHTKKIPICGTDGTPQYLLGISEDITDRKQAEEALQQNDARLNAAQRIAHIGSWDLDLVENILTWSDENYCIFEIDSAHFGASYAAFLELVHPDDRQFVNESYTESVANRTCYNIEHRLLMSDGRVKFVHEQCETFYAPDGRPTRSIGTTQDITDRKQAVEALRKSEEQLRKVLEEREQLSQDLHDNIIQTIYAIGMSLEECRYLVQEDRRAADKKLEHAVGCLNRVISDVRMYIVWDKHEEVSGQQFCAKLAELAVTMESMQGIRFSLHLAVEAARRLTPLGAFHILHIVQEAMSNSLRHSKSRSGHVSLQMEEGRIRLEISDDGIGFNLEEASGQGHGLQNMAARAHKLGANFQIISQPGSGAQILVELPLEDQHASASS